MIKQFYFKQFHLAQVNQVKWWQYYYLSQTIQLNTSHLFAQLNDQTVLFQIIQFSLSQQS